MTGLQGTSLVLSAALKQASGGLVTHAEAIIFSIDGMAVGTATINSSSTAGFTYAVPANATVCAHTVTATFACDYSYGPSRGTGTLAVQG